MQSTNRSATLNKQHSITRQRQLAPNSTKSTADPPPCHKPKKKNLGDLDAHPGHENGKNQQTSILSIKSTLALWTWLPTWTHKTRPHHFPLIYYSLTIVRNVTVELLFSARFALIQLLHHYPIPKTDVRVS